MPKDTFFNLPEKKRLTIENAAIDEFVTWGFDAASINRIVARCKIAKGSFYQYFTDKADLFKHLLARFSEGKLAHISPILHNPDAYDFYTLIGELYRSGLAFAQQEPKQVALSYLVFKNREHPVFREIFRESQTAGKLFYGGLLQTAIAKGDVRADINQDFIAHMLISLNIMIFEYYLEQVENSEVDFSKVEIDIMDIVLITLDFIRNGIGSNNRPAATAHFSAAQTA